MNCTIFDLMKSNGIFPGSVVLSTKGHDVNRIYLVISVKEKMTLIVNGIGRNATNPKKKRVTHLVPVGMIGDGETKINQLVAAKPNEQNKLIREWISDVLDQIRQKEEETTCQRKMS